MENDIYNSIAAGLKEAVSFERGLLPHTRRKKIIINPAPGFEGKEIRNIRMMLNLTQVCFAHAMGVSVKTVEAWESGKNKPNGSASRMLDIFKKDRTALEKYKIIEIVSG